MPKLSTQKKKKKKKEKRKVLDMNNYFDSIRNAFTNHSKRMMIKNDLGIWVRNRGVIGPPKWEQVWPIGPSPLFGPSNA